MIKIGIDGKVELLKYGGDYHEIYKAICCDCFDIVRLNDTLTMFVDDEGLLKPDPIGHVNWKATYLRLMSLMRNPDEYSWDAIRRCPPLIVGDVVILGTDADGHDTVDLNNASTELVLEWLGED